MIGVVASAHVEAVGGFDPLSIGWHTAFWAEDPAWSHPADGVAVSQWDDATGNARHAIQTATPGRQPLYRSSVAALNSKPAVDFVSADALSTATWTGIALGWSLVAVAHLRVTGNSLSVTDGDDTSHRAILGTSSGGLFRFACGSGVNGAAMDTNAHLFLGFSANSAAGAFELDGTLTSGTTGSHTNTGLTLGSGFSETSANIQGEIAFVGLYATDVRAHGSWSAFEAWVTSHYGITIS